MNYYTKFRAIFPNEVKYLERYAEIEILVGQIEKEMENFGEMVGGIEYKRDLWSKVNRFYALVSLLDTESEIIKNATERDWVIKNE